MPTSLPGQTAPECADLIAALRAAGDRILAVTADPVVLGRRVPGCPDWDLAGLLGHLGQLWYFHAGHLVRGVTDPPDPATRPEPPADPALLADWAGLGFENLFAALSATPPQAPAWNWARKPPVAGFWHRRMTHEALVHRRDAEQAAGAAVTGYGPLAGDALDELLDVFVPRARARRPWTGPTGTVLVNATDSGTRWQVRVGPGTDTVLQRLGGAAAVPPGDPPAQGAPEGSRDGQVALQGRAEALVLALWGREPLEPLARGPVELARALVVE